MTALDVSANASRRADAIKRARLIRSAILFIGGSTILYALYLLIIAPAQYHSSSSFAIRGAQAGTSDALSALGIVAPTSNTADAQVIENFIKSDAMVAGLRQRYGFNEAFDKFSLDPSAHLSPSASLSKATRFWKHKIEVVSDPLTAGATVKVSAYSAEDSIRLARGVLTLSEELVNSLPGRAVDQLIAAGEQEINNKRRTYETARDRLAEFQGRNYSGVAAATPAQQAIGLVGSLDGQLAQKRAELATAGQTFQPGAPQLTGLQREIAALEAERDRALQSATRAPGERAAAGDIEAQSLLLDYQVAQEAYQASVRALESVRRQQVVDRKYIVSYVPPQRPQGSDWWSRLSNILAVFLGASIIWAVGALVYSIIRDHVE